MTKNNATKNNAPGLRRRSAAFTLVELLVVIAVVGMLIALLLPALSSVRGSVRRSQCGSQMRQLGIAMHAFAESQNGWLPKATGHGLDADASWVAKLGPFLEEADIVRICSADPEADYRMENDLTSYVLNGFCTRVDEDHEDEDHDHEDHDHEHEDLPLAGAYANLHQLKSTTTAVLLFEAAPGAHGDHVDSWDWFEHEHVEEGTVYDIISAEVATERHRGSANYLYADAHVDSIDAATIAQWAKEGTEEANFARPR
jgi:prepilin-type processing-associated H-X9-DG protein/prepilin-type N-terminal cleavage/methylation domain-containing protein